MSTDAGTFFVSVGPTRVRVRTVGDGPPLVLLMGIGGNLSMWDPLVARLPGRTHAAGATAKRPASSAPMSGVTSALRSSQVDQAA